MDDIDDEFETESLISEVVRELDGIKKRLSSIEIELILTRGGSLDNNFQGKERM